MTADTDHDTDFYFISVEYKATSLIFHTVILVYTSLIYLNKKANILSVMNESINLAPNDCEYNLLH